jgi:hypothetical protein
MFHLTKFQKKRIWYRMSEKLIELYEVTMNLVMRIDEADSTELTSLVELRSEVLDVFMDKKKLSETEKQMLLKVNEFDSIIVTRMNQIKDDATEGINKINRMRLHKKKYDQTEEPTSFFFDKRK